MTDATADFVCRLAARLLVLEHDVQKLTDRLERQRLAARPPKPKPKARRRADNVVAGPWPKPEREDRP